MHITNSIPGGRFGPFGKKIRRTIPVYLASVILFLFLTQFNHESVERYQHAPRDVLQRIMQYKSSFNSRGSKFPKKIWQTWKTDPLEFEARESDRARSWPRLNPDWRYEVLTDGNDLEYVERVFGPEGENRLDIVETYRTLNATIIKADLLRYMVMYIEGGVYADIDVEALRPINSWIPDQFNMSDVDFVIGVEIDEPTFVNHTILGQKSESFCQWTFMCKPRLPVMMRLINHVLHWLNEISQRQNKPISEITLNFDEVITGTGPSAFTNVVMAEMMVQTGHRMHWETFQNISEPVLVGNTLVLTVEAFAAGQGHSHSGNHDNPLALVRHHYHASLWPSRHPRYSHPAYGQVEECNWDRACVDWWTEHTDNWDNLSEEEQKKAIEKHEERNKERFEKEEEERLQHEKEEKEQKDEELRNSCKAASYVPAFLIDPDKIAEYVAAFQTPATESPPPPADAPPADAPPADAPPADEKDVKDAPPKDAPPADTPPANEKDVKDAPPKDTPPKDAPPAETPATNEKDVKDAPPADAPPKDALPKEPPVDPKLEDPHAAPRPDDIVFPHADAQPEGPADAKDAKVASTDGGLAKQI